MGTENPCPGVADPHPVAFTVAAVSLWAEGVEVASEPVFASLDDLDVARLAAFVDDVALGRDRVALTRHLELEDVGDDVAIIGIERVESIPDRLDLVQAERHDRRLAVGRRVRAAWTGDQVTTVLGRDDGHGVGVAGRIPVNVASPVLGGGCDGHVRDDAQWKRAD